jgi:hypothetical protein
MCYSAIPRLTLKPAEAASEIVVLKTDFLRPGIQIKLLIVLASTMHETDMLCKGIFPMERALFLGLLPAVSKFMHTHRLVR